jgi:hypothetical protein
MQKIAVSSISLLPFSWGPGGPGRIFKIIRQVGIKVQLIPMLGWEYNDFGNFPASLVSSYEGSWLNSFSELKTEGKKLDWITPICPILFGSRATTEKQLGWFRRLFPYAPAIDLPWGIQEILSKEKKSLDYYSNHPGPFVFDTWHIREKELNLEDIRRLLEKMLSQQKVHLFHLQTRSRKEFLEFLNGKETIMGQMLKIFVQKRQADKDIVLEFPPFFLWPKIVSNLIRLKNQVENYLNPT